MVIEGPEASRISARWILPLGATLIWAALPWPILAVWVLAYLGLWGVLQVTLREGVPRRIAGLLVLVVLLMTPRIWDHLRVLPELEGLSGLSQVWSDRRALEGDVLLRPRLVRDDRPQRFFVTAPSAQRVVVQLGGSELTAEPLGHDLHYVDYDPRRHGAPGAEGAAQVQLTIDGRPREVPVQVVWATPHPRSLVVAGDRVWAVSAETDQLLGWSGSGLEVVPVGDGPVALARTGDRLVLGLRYQGGLELRRPKDGTLTGTIAVSGEVVALAGSASQLAIALAGTHPRIELWSGTPLEQKLELPLDEPPDRLGLSEDDRWILVSQRRSHLLSIWSRSDDGAYRPLRTPLRFGRPVAALAVQAERGAAVLALAGDPPDGTGTNHAIDDQLVEIDLHTGLIRARISTRLEGEDGVEGGVAPRGLLATAEGYWVSFSGSDELAFWRPGQPLARRPSPVLRPIGLAWLHGELVISSPATGQLAAGGRVVTVPPGPGPFGQRLRQGELDYYEGTRAGLSCESCHLDRDSDQALHDIGHGTPRPTLSILGIAQTAPYLRGASYPSLASLDDFAHGVLGGYRVERADRAANVAAFLEGLGPEVQLPPLGEAARAGFLAFVKAGCAACHRPPAFTDLAQYPAGMIFPERTGAPELLDTPSLRSVGATSPYLYDGRAVTLESVFEDHDPGRAHGDYAQLDVKERAALFAFLRAL